MKTKMRAWWRKKLVVWTLKAHGWEECELPNGNGRGWRKQARKDLTFMGPEPYALAHLKKTA